MSQSDFAGTGTMLRLALRRDRWLLPAWVLGIAAVAMFSAAATKDLYPTVASRTEAAQAINATAAFVALYGKVYDPTSLGALSLIKMTAFGTALVGIVFVFLMIRHTRTDEETGRLELLAAGALGRMAPLAAAFGLCAIGSVTLGLATASGLAAVGLPLAGSIAFGLAWTLAGLVFSCVAALAAQLALSHRTALGIGIVAVAVAYLIRAVGDLVDGDPAWLSWLSPIGWSQQLRPFAGDRWWVSLIAVIAVLAATPLAFWLRAGRDLGAGLIPERDGPSSGRLGSSIALLWRLQRGTVIAWASAAVVMGFILGTVAHNVTDLLSSEAMRAYIAALGGEQGLMDAFLAAAISIVGTIFGAYAVTTMLRLRSEETAGHTELLLSTATSRVRQAAGECVIVVASIIVLLTLTGAAFGLGHGIEVGDIPGNVGRLALAGLAQAPAVLVMAGLVLALFGWVPRATAAAWGVLVAFIVLGEFGALWELPQWLLDASPFAHSPRLPGGDVSWSALASLVAIAVVLAVIGTVGWRRRDLSV